MKALWVSIHIFLVLAQAFGQPSVEPVPSSRDVSWPSTFAGRALLELELGEREIGWARGFPGAIARFSDGHSELIMRHVERPTRKLHPIADCLKGVGFSVSPEPLERDGKDRLWGCQTAERSEDRYLVCELITDPQENSWSDVSSWWWAATLKKTKGPWLSVVRINRL